MYQIDFNKPLHIHFIGIGGISMSGLAEILLKEGFPHIRFRLQKVGTDCPSGEPWRHCPHWPARFQYHR